MSGAEASDWSLRIFDPVDLSASDFAASVRFYEAVLAPLGIRKLLEDDESACFANFNVEALYRDAGNVGHGMAAGAALGRTYVCVGRTPGTRAAWTRTRSAAPRRTRTTGRPATSR